MYVLIAFDTCPKYN